MAIDKKFIEKFSQVTSKAALEVTLINLSINFLSIAIKFFHQLIHSQLFETQILLIFYKHSLIQ